MRGLADKRLLPLLIVLLLILVEGLHFKLKPRLTKQQVTRISQTFKPAYLQGKWAPPFRLQKVDGGFFDLSDEVGKKVVVVNFFATWCGPCREEMPELERYYQAHSDGSFRFLAIDCKETTEKVKDYISKLHLTFPVAIDDGPVQKEYGVTAYPTTVLIGVDGKVQFYLAGEIQNANVAFDGMLRVNERFAKTGLATTRAAYLMATSAPAKAPPHPITLSGRAERIAVRMPCPCGCDKKVAACDCHTARSIESDLESRKFGNLSDAQIMTQLNRKYCMAGM